MEFAVICPISALETYGKLTKTHMCLYHITAPVYWNFYRERQEQGDLIILDCSAYEGVPFCAEQYADRIDDLRPEIVVMPDLLLEEWKKSFHFSFGMREYLERKTYWRPKWMFIPQSVARDQEGFTASYFRAITEEGIDHIGLPRMLCSHFDPFARVELAKIIIENYPSTYIHAMGFGGTINELYYLEKAGVKSIDSSAPVWRGWNGYDIEAPWPDYRFDPFATSYNPLYECTIHNNLRKVGIDVSSLQSRPNNQTQE